MAVPLSATGVTVEVAQQMTLLDPTKTVRRANRRGQLQVWEATSADGKWLYLRGDETGTPWHLEHLPTGRVVLFAAATLTGARRCTASGWALAELDRRATAVVAEEITGLQVVAA
jgi:hypothetical protein